MTVLHGDAGSIHSHGLDCCCRVLLRCVNKSFFLLVAGWIWNHLSGITEFHTHTQTQYCVIFRFWGLQQLFLRASGASFQRFRLLPLASSFLRKIFTAFRAESDHRRKNRTSVRVDHSGHFPNPTAGQGNGRADVTSFPESFRTFQAEIPPHFSNFSPFFSSGVGFLIL